MLRLQLCAIYSQLHKHKAAFEQAELSAQTAHSAIMGKHALLSFLVNKEKIMGQLREAEDEQMQQLTFETELVFQNQVESSMGILEKQAKFQRPIYMELVKLITTI